MDKHPQHTPGPWRVEWLDDNNGWVMDASGNYLATLVTKDEQGKCASGDEQVFNLTLMAAAPQMLQALMNMIQRPKTMEADLCVLIGEKQYEKLYKNIEDLEAKEVIAIAMGEKLPYKPPYSRTISWNTEDVYQEGVAMGYSLDEPACRLVLDRVIDHHDAETGIKWSVFQYEIERWAEENDIEPIYSEDENGKDDTLGNVVAKHLTSGN